MAQKMFHQAHSGAGIVSGGDLALHLDQPGGPADTGLEDQARDVEEMLPHIGVYLGIIRDVPQIDDEIGDFFQAGAFPETWDRPF